MWKGGETRQAPASGRGAERGKAVQVLVARTVTVLLRLERCESCARPVRDSLKSTLDIHSTRAATDQCTVISLSTVDRVRSSISLLLQLQLQAVHKNTHQSPRHCRRATCVPRNLYLRCDGLLHLSAERKRCTHAACGSDVHLHTRPHTPQTTPTTNEVDLSSTTDSKAVGEELQLSVQHRMMHIRGTVEGHPGALSAQ